MKQRERYIFWGLIALAALLRFITLGSRPFDGDEGVILKIAELPWRDLIAASAVDVHPPLYHLLVHFAIGIFGVHEWSVRLVGVLAGIGLVALAPALGRTMKVPGWLLGLLLATSPFLVNLNQDARMYSVLVFLSATLWCVTYAIATDTKNSWGKWIGWVILALAVVYIHHIGWLIVGLFGLVLIWQTTKNPPQSPFTKGGSNETPLFRKEGLGEIFKRGSVAIGILILGYLPILHTTISQVQGRLHEQSATAGIGDTLKGVVGGLYRMLAGRTFLDLNPSAIVDMITSNPLGFTAFIFTLLVPLFVLITGLVGRSGNTSEVASVDDDSSEVPARIASQSDAGGKEEHSWRQEALLIIGISLIVAIGVGSIGTQASRYLSFLAPLIYAFLAIGILRIWPFNWGKAATAVIALTFIAGLGTQYVRHNQAAGDNVYAKTIEEQSQPGDIVLLRGAFAGGEARAFEYYRNKLSSTPGALDLALKSKASMPIPFALETVDMFADYDVRKANLAELKAIDPAQKAAELLSRPGINRVWYFDNSYQEPTLQDLPSGLTAEVVPLFTTDKEGKPLILTKVTRK